MCATVLVALIPVNVALKFLHWRLRALLAVILTALILYEVLRYADARDRVRHSVASASGGTTSN